MQKKAILVPTEVYICDGCKVEFKDADEAELCELSHKYMAIPSLDTKLAGDIRYVSSEADAATLLDAECECEFEGPGWYMCRDIPDCEDILCECSLQDYCSAAWVLVEEHVADLRAAHERATITLNKWSTLLESLVAPSNK